MPCAKPCINAHHHNHDSPAHAVSTYMMTMVHPMHSAVHSIRLILKEISGASTSFHKHSVRRVPSQNVAPQKRHQGFGPLNVHSMAACTHHLRTTLEANDPIMLRILGIIGHPVNPVLQSCHDLCKAFLTTGHGLLCGNC